MTSRRNLPTSPLSTSLAVLSLGAFALGCASTPIPDAFTGVESFPPHRPVETPAEAPEAESRRWTGEEAVEVVAPEKKEKDQVGMQRSRRWTGSKAALLEPEIDG